MFKRFQSSKSHIFFLSKTNPFLILLIIHLLQAVQFTFKNLPVGNLIWNGCIFRKADWLLPSNDTKCGRCVENNTVLGKNSKKYYMGYRNCTSECPQPTLCTEYKFNIKGKWRSECYVCEADTREKVVYRAIPQSELCGKECARCAAKADLSKAVTCSSKCKGMPTFCAPGMAPFFGQRICYQSRKLHGCHFQRITAHELRMRYSRSCVDCAKRAKRGDAYLCSHLCGNLPTWHKHAIAQNKRFSRKEQDNNSTDSSITAVYKMVYFHCTLKPLGGVLDYEIPSAVRPYLKEASAFDINLGPQEEEDEFEVTNGDGGEESEVLPVLSYYFQFDKRMDD